MVDIIKKRCYIVSSLYDDEIKSLINSCQLDAVTSGISEKSFEKRNDGYYDDLVLTLVTAYVKAYRGNDRKDSEEYLKMYYCIRDKLTQLSDYRSKANE